MTKVSIELPARIFLRNHNGEALYVTAEAMAKVVDKLVEVGAKTILTNVWNGGGKDATDAERLAALQKKMDSWARGEFNVVERGESQYSAWKEVYLSDCVASGATLKQAEDNLKAKVAEFLGKDTKATFSNFIEACAIEAGGNSQRAEARAAFEKYYGDEAAKREAARAKVSTKIAMPAINLASFKKAD